jgi:hypothetical protein
MFSSIAFSLANTNSLKNASLLELAGLRLKSSLAYHILTIYQTHGFYVKPPQTMVQNNEFLYDWLRSDLSKNKKLSRLTQRGTTMTNIPIVLCLIVHLIKKKVIQITSSWAENTSRVMFRTKEWSPYRVWYKLMFSFDNFKSNTGYSLLHVFNILVFGRVHTSPINMEGDKPKEEGLSESVSRSILDSEEDESVESLLKLLEQVEDQSETKKPGENFLNSALVKKTFDSGDDEKTLNELTLLQHKLVSNAALVGINIAMIRESGRNIQVDDEDMSSPIIFDSKYLKGATASKKGKSGRKSPTVQYPSEALAPLTTFLNSEVTRLTSSLGDFAFRMALSPDYDKLWDYLNKVGTEDAEHYVQPLPIEMKTMLPSSIAKMFAIDSKFRDSFYKEITAILRKYEQDPVEHQVIPRKHTYHADGGSPNPNRTEDDKNEDSDASDEDECDRKLAAKPGASVKPEIIPH